MLGHQLGHDLDGAFETETLARPDVQFVGNLTQLLLTVYREVHAHGQVLADQAVG
ncbi:hypothetical protein D3C84_1318500 [compost metagenome]